MDTLISSPLPDPTFSPGPLHELLEADYYANVKWMAQGRVDGSRILVERWTPSSITICGITTKFMVLKCTAIAKLTKSGELGSSSRWDNERYLVRDTYSAWCSAGRPIPFTFRQ